MSVLCAVPRGLAVLSPQKPLMSWAWNAGREEGRRGFGEGDASHLFPRPKVPKINSTHSYAGQSGKTEGYQSPITPNYSPPRQINPEQKQRTKISLIPLKSNVLQTSVFWFCFLLRKKKKKKSSSLQQIFPKRRAQALFPLAAKAAATGTGIRKPGRVLAGSRPSGGPRALA